MSNIDWLERRRRAARCKIHGLHYDPSMTSGCILCRKEGLLREKPKGPQLIMLLLALLGLAVVAFQIYGPVARTVSGLTSRPAVSENPTKRSPGATPKIDPETLRTPLERFETAILSPRSDRVDDIRYEILTSTQRLAQHVQQIQTPYGQDAASDLSALAGMIDSGNFDLQALEKVRKKWFQTRADNFQPAVWFQAPKQGDAPDRAKVAIYREIATELQAIISDGAQNIGEQPPDSDTWNSLRSVWTAKVQSLSQRLPERPGTATDVQLLFAVQTLEQSLAEMKRLSSASSAPVGQSHFDSLGREVQDVLRTLDELLI